jgi:alkylation response protein AidB-like acyl-CoA dehydrogenase
MSIDKVLAKAESMPSEGELLRRVEELAPLIRAHVDWQESSRRMAPEVFDALGRSGMFALWKPRAAGGYETHPVTALKVFEALSRIDASVGWAVANQDGLDLLTGAVLDSPGALEILADPTLPVSGAGFPLGVAHKVDGGYVVSGRWSFSSTCHGAQALSVIAVLHDESGPVTGPEGLPVRLLMCCNDDLDAKIVEGSWRTMGMRGSGSNDIVMNDVFIADRHAGVIGGTGPATEGPFAGPIYALCPWLMIATSGPVGLGIAEAAIDALVDLAATKTPNHTMRALRDREHTQAAVGRSRAIVNGARAYLHQSVGAVYAARSAGHRPTKQEHVDVQLAACSALEAAPAVVRMVHDVAGSSGFQEGLPFQQLLRDSHTMGQNTFASVVRYETCGQVLLNMPTDWGFMVWGLAR